MCLLPHLKSFTEHIFVDVSDVPDLPILRSLTKTLGTQKRLWIPPTFPAKGAVADVRPSRFDDRDIKAQFLARCSLLHN
jgi:hypothetical protein